METKGTYYTSRFLVDAVDRLMDPEPSIDTVTANPPFVRPREPMACPFCGHLPHPKDHVRWEDDVVYYSVNCRNCGAMGPNDISREKAVEMWNLRRT